MTIRYNAEVATATFSGFHKLLLRLALGEVLYNIGAYVCAMPCTSNLVFIEVAQ